MFSLRQGLVMKGSAQGNKQRELGSGELKVNAGLVKKS